MNIVTIKPTNLFRRLRLNGVFGIAMAILACLLTASFPEKVSGQVTRSEQQSLQTPSRTQPDGGQAKMSASAYPTGNWVSGHQQAVFGPPAMSERPLFIINNFVRIVFVVGLLLPAAILMRWPTKQNSRKASTSTNPALEEEPAVGAG